MNHANRWLKLIDAARQESKELQKRAEKVAEANTTEVKSLNKIVCDLQQQLFEKERLIKLTRIGAEPQVVSQSDSSRDMKDDGFSNVFLKWNVNQGGYMKKEMASTSLFERVRSNPAPWVLGGVVGLVLAPITGVAVGGAALVAGLASGGTVIGVGFIGGTAVTIGMVGGIGVGVGVGAVLDDKLGKREELGIESKKETKLDEANDIKLDSKYKVETKKEKESSRVKKESDPSGKSKVQPKDFSKKIAELEIAKKIAEDKHKSLQKVAEDAQTKCIAANAKVSELEKKIKEQEVEVNASMVLMKKLEEELRVSKKEEEKVKAEMNEIKHKLRIAEETLKKANEELECFVLLKAENDSLRLERDDYCSKYEKEKAEKSELREKMESTRFSRSPDKTSKSRDSFFSHSSKEKSDIQKESKGLGSSSDGFDFWTKTPIKKEEAINQPDSSQDKKDDGFSI